MISVVLATHNESRNLRGCLDAVADLADEIIIVDGESSDGTVELAQSLGAEVISTTNKANFHINKQMAIDAAQGDLIVQLDADEIVDAPLKQWLLDTESARAAGTLPEQPVAWYVRRRNFFLGRFLSKGGQYPDPVIRIFLRGKAWLPQKNVHEQMTVSGETGTADGHLLHYPYHTFDDYMVKFNRYTSFEAGRQESETHALEEGAVWRRCIWLPLKTFFLLYVRHKGFLDGMAGLVFSAMSALHHPFVYLKRCELHHEKHRQSEQVAA